MLPGGEISKYKFVDKLRLIIIALILDFLDYFGIPLLPIIGDVIDLFGTLLFYTISRDWKTSAITLVELIPMADVVPTYTLVALYLLMRG